MVVGEGFEGVAALLLADLGDVEVADGVLDRAVSQVAGDLEDGRSAFQHVRGEGVPQGVGGDVFVRARQPAFGDGNLDGLPDGGFAHGFGAAVHGLLDGQAGAFPSATDTGKEPLFILMVGPVFPQALEHLGGDGHLAGLVDFGLANVDDESLAFDILRSEIDGFVQAETALIDERAVGAEADISEGPKEAVDFLSCKDFGEWLVAFDVNLFPDVPVNAEVVAVKGSQGADGLIDRAGAELSLVLEVDEEVEDSLGRELRQVIIRVVVAELVNPSVVDLASALGEAFELDKAVEVLIPLG